MAYQGKGWRGRGGRAFMVNDGDGYNHGNPNQNRNEIKELSEQVATLYDKVQRLQRPTERKDSISLENRFGAPHWRRANLVRFKYTILIMNFSSFVKAH
ncbi:hypothetical protein RHMOL_Rhmol04G0001100 [Rhododendron molle]|uniref:Uncharacterized protein n=1 Tax=Rhododendron molle TaxID=49168 RepID=A0ACC0NWP3_RHOML|nr:hypothetical protein RHMOL_Rhmol04G0001100 [Rhododendron molle]